MLCHQAIRAQNGADLNYVNAHYMLNWKSVFVFNTWLIRLVDLYLFVYIACSIFLWHPLFFIPLRQTVIYDRNLVTPPQCQEGKWSTKSCGWDKSACTVANGCWSCTRNPPHQLPG